MPHKFHSIGSSFPEHKKYFEHDTAKSCIKEMIKADKKGSVLLGFLNRAIVEKSDLKNDKKVKKVIQAAFDQIKKYEDNSKKLKLTQENVSECKKLKELFKKPLSQKIEPLPTEKAKEPTYWQAVTLPKKYSYPPATAQDAPGVYATEFPTAPLAWYYDPESGEHRSTSTFWISNKLEAMSGVSFKGFIKKEALGVRENEFAVFYHEKQHYDGGPEYGWVFPENSHQGFFYLLTDANLSHQHWAQWPGDLAADNPEFVQAVSNLSKEQYWNIKVQKNGDFLIEIVDPATWKIESCTIKKPDWFPNLHEKNGYITVCAQKRKDPTVTPTPYLSIDQVKIWK